MFGPFIGCVSSSALPKRSQVQSCISSIGCNVPWKVGETFLWFTFKRPPLNICSHRVNILTHVSKEEALLCKQFLWAKLGAEPMEGFGKHDMQGWAGFGRRECVDSSCQGHAGEPVGLLTGTWGCQKYVYWCWAVSYQLNWQFLVTMTADQVFLPFSPLWFPLPLIGAFSHKAAGSL